METGIGRKKKKEKQKGCFKMKKSFAKLTALCLAAAVAFGAAGCGKDKKEAQQEDKVTSADGEKEKETQKEADALQTAVMLADGAPELQAEAAILIEASSGTILYEKNPTQKMFPASMTKMLTALVALDYFQPDDLIEVGTEINEISLDSSKAGHELGETLTVRNAIRGLIIPSGNDSANVVAAAVAKKVEKDDSMTFGKCEVIFTDLMNKKAEELGATNSHFANAHGYHSEDHYTCAHDLALIGKAFMQNETLAGIAKEKSYSGNGAEGLAKDDAVKTQEYNWRSHNLLITDGEYNYPYAIGIKTGFTNEAGDCVTAAAEKNGEELIAVIFHSEDPNRWLDAKNLFDYGYKQYERITVAKAEEAIAEAALTKHKKSEGNTVPVVFKKEVVALLPKATAEDMKLSVAYNDTYAVTDKEGKVSLKAPIEKGAEIGTATYEVNGKTVLEAPVYAGREVSKGTIFSAIGDFFKNLFTLKGLIKLVVVILVIGIILLIIKFINGRRNRNSYSFGSSRRSSLSMGGGRRGRRGGRRRRF